MKGPNRFAWDDRTYTPATPVVYPIDDHVREGLLGPDGKPLTEGTKRKNPIGFGKAN